MASPLTFRERMRVAALDSATVVSEPGMTPVEITDIAGWFEAWLTKRSLMVVVAEFTYPQGGGPPSPARMTGGTLIMKDTDQILATITAKDVKGFVAPDNVTWAEDSGGSVLTLQPADDSMSCVLVGQGPGSAVVTVSDGTISGTVSVDVTTGDVASISISLGDPEPQPST